MRGGPSRTAEAVALARAVEALRPPERRIVDDPHARHFLGPLPRAAVEALARAGPLGPLAAARLPSVLTYALARHRLLDDAIRAATGQEALLLLGAGYDTRAWRLHEVLGERTVWEVDHPATAARKAARARAIRAPAARRRVVTVDFQSQDLGARLDEEGVPRGRPLFISWEGVTMYLTRRAVRATLDTLRRRVAPGSLLAVDFWYLLDRPDPAATAHRLSPGLLHLLGEPVLMALHPEDAPAFLARHGWELVSMHLADDIAARLTAPRRCYPACYVVLARAGAPPRLTEES